MANGKFIAYYRVSTARQGQSGLGLEAQRTAVIEWLNGGSHELVAEFTEVETGTSKRLRPELAAAIAEAKKAGATLVIAKLHPPGGSNNASVNCRRTECPRHSDCAGWPVVSNDGQERGTAR
jgi:DNA invertase Pin-like site-specific DNA recombinase